MKVIEIHTKWDGIIGIAKNYKCALFYLYNNSWLKGSMEIWNESKDAVIRLKEDLGEEWFERMLNWDIENFNDYWGGSFILIETEVYDVA